MLLRYQLRALIQAVAGKELHLMFPMIAELEELLEGKRLLGLELERTQKHKKQNPPSSIKIGIMIEVPSNCVVFL
jgi:phosphotransferase system enzyme I (PtsP)